ncbi:zinc dependent phospholipase C family protein [Dawidia soli]|uniref:zinc dependent phospholipase C family protein n=1 Tax=Dawidia soli TaxID=2782352 RepID=UPI0020B39337|nr:zinc dependent phospholipase C family protein [Dawidia soli]
MKLIRHCFPALILLTLTSLTIPNTTWGFFAHRRINRLAVFILPPEMIGFYKKNIAYLTEAAVNPDRRRFILPDEAPRHYIDLDHFGDSARHKVPQYWDSAVSKYSEDTLKAHGILPWHIVKTYYRLKDAMMIRDAAAILRLSADLGHYIGDAHVPLHTTVNYNGQRTGQEGIHAFWESRLPELFSDNYDFFVGKAKYIEHPQTAAWNAVLGAHSVVDSVLQEEKKLALRRGNKKYSFETRGTQTQKVYAREYAAAYHQIVGVMVERQMRAAIHLTGSIWYTAWVNAGQPDLQALTIEIASEEELEERRSALRDWKEQQRKIRDHE